MRKFQVWFNFFQSHLTINFNFFGCSHKSQTLIKLYFDELKNHVKKCFLKHPSMHLMKFTWMHLDDAFIPSNMQCIYLPHVISSCLLVLRPTVWAPERVNLCLISAFPRGAFTLKWVDDDVNVSVAAGGAPLDSFWRLDSEVGHEKMERRTAAQQKTHPSLTLYSRSVRFLCSE